MVDNGSTPTWRKSTYSGYASECVEVLELPYNEIAIRDSKNPKGGTLVMSRKQFAEWVAGAADGEFDDLT